MKKVAIPVVDGKLSPHFGHCENFVIYNIEDQNILNETKIPSPPHQPGLLPHWLANYHVTDLIVGGIGHKAIQLFNQHKINVFVGAAVKDTKELVSDYLNGTLETNGNLCNH